MDSSQSQYGMKKILYGWFIQIILPALIATLLPRGNLGQTDRGAMLTKPWIEAGVGVAVGAECPDRSDLSLRQESKCRQRARLCRTEAVTQVCQDYCLFNKFLFSPPIYFIKLSVHV